MVVKSKVLLSIFVDFLILTVGLSLVLGCVFVGKAILYPEQKGGVELRIRTEIMSEEYACDVAVGSVVFDTLTKRKLGVVKELSIEKADDGIRFFMMLDAAFTPRSKALRTESLWFYFATEEI